MALVRHAALGPWRKKKAAEVEIEEKLPNIQRAHRACHDGLRNEA